MALQFPYGTNSKKLKGGFISDSCLPHKKEDCIDFSTYWPAVSTIESVRIRPYYETISHSLGNAVELIQVEGIQTSPKYPISPFD